MEPYVRSLCDAFVCVPIGKGAFDPFLVFSRQKLLTLTRKNQKEMAEGRRRPQINSFKQLLKSPG